MFVFNTMSIFAVADVVAAAAAAAAATLGNREQIRARKGGAGRVPGTATQRRFLQKIPHMRGLTEHPATRGESADVFRGQSAAGHATTGSTAAGGGENKQPWQL